MKPYRKLTESEIEILKNNKCWADDWSHIEVPQTGFHPGHYHLARFSGNIRLGVTEKKITFEGGMSVRCGIFDAKIHNCTLGDNVYLSHINQYIANYDIGDNVIITNTDCVLTDGMSTFGNGVNVSVLNETGGREVPIYDRLSSQLAYILALYRHHPVTISRITEMIQEYAHSVSSDRGTIHDNVKITNCGLIRNVRIGAATRIDGAARLNEGSINSTEQAPVFVGKNVIADHFIVGSASKISDGAIIDKCFIGQGCEMGKQYSAENSLFFANCVGMHGEACAVFAGPYTVTHHKSTLLIAGLYSFMNAGSGSNQSNHMYKLGPIHQGIAERGTKTTSDSYILWPAKIGAFSLVMGRHYNNCDTSLLPFSYLIESDNESVLIPGVNLRSVGTIRDAKKWPKRDKRKGDDKIDQINFNLLSPFTIHKMLKGVDTLNSLVKASGETSKAFSYQSCRINNSSLFNGLKYYDIAITKFFGNSIIKRLEKVSGNSAEEIKAALLPTTDIGKGSWIDISGLLAPKSEILRLLDKISGGEINSLDAIHAEFVRLQQNYYEYEWTWVYEKVSHHIEDIGNVTVQQILDYVNKWIDAVTTLDRLVYEDAKKEFTLSARTGFGADGGRADKKKDFENVRGEFENNDFVVEVLNHIERKTALGKELIERLKNLA